MIGEGDRMNDLISRQVAIDAVKRLSLGETDAMRLAMRIGDYLERLPPAQPEQRWIPFKTRPLTEEEQDEHPEWDCILDCKLPDDGQVILVSINPRGHERVQYDEFYTDDGSFLDCGYAIGAEASAWMPLPEPYREERKEE